MGKVRNVRPRKMHVAPGTIGNLYSQETTSTWRAPDVLPPLDDRYKVIGYDLESDGVDWMGKSMPIGYCLALEDGTDMYLPIRHKGGGNLDPGLVKRYLQTELKGKQLATAEGKFEVHMSRKDGIDLEAMGCKIREIQYKAALLNDLRRNYDLGTLAHDFIGATKLELDRTRIWELPAAEVGPYGEHDARITLDTHLAMVPQIEEEGLTRVAALEDDLIFCVCEMERNGAPLDVPKLERWRVEVRRRYQDDLMEIYNQTGLNINPDAAGDMARLFDVLELQYGRTAPTVTYPHGQPSFTDEFLKSVHHPLVAKAREVKTLRSLLSKYLDAYGKVRRNHYLHYKLHQLKNDEYGTVSGRFSSSSKNIQQVYAPGRQKKKLGTDEYIIRELFIPEEGYDWVRCDAKQIEFRGFAHYANSERLLQFYRDNPDIDFHDVVMEMLRKKVDIDRDDSKNMNFGRLYGMGKDKNARKLGISRAEADELFTAYDAEFPEARQLMNKAMNLAEKRGFVKTILGRIARFPEMADPRDRRLHSALNRVIQGTAADIMKLKLLEVYNNRHLLKLKMFFTVHDEIDGQQPKGDLLSFNRYRELLNTQIEEIKFRVPILWDVKSGPNWAACK